MKKAIILLNSLLLSSTLFSAVPTIKAEELMLEGPAEGAGYCHLKFPAIREDSLSWEKPVLDTASGNTIDYYGPCDHDPLGAEEIRTQRQIHLRGFFGDGGGDSE